MAEGHSAFYEKEGVGASDEEGALGEEALKNVAPTPDFEVIEAMGKASSFLPHQRVSNVQMRSRLWLTYGFNYRVWPLYLQSLS